jgi:hypothetical protein
MKNAIKIFGIAFVLLTLASNVVAQVSATALATANIIAPLSIGKISDMNFGNVAVNATSGSIILSTADGRTGVGGATPVPTQAGIVSAAKFNIAGADGYIVTITLPASQIVKHGTDQMTINTFVSNPVTGFSFTTGTPSMLYVGATLNVAGSQPYGLYVSDAPGFTVTIQYN